jgi:short-subunit dehydrogenase
LRAVAHLGLVARGQERLEDARREVEFGPIDVWVNDAMTTVFSPVASISPEDCRRVTEVTYLGFVYGTMAALKCMRSRDRGTIVQVGSALAYRSIPLQAAYCGAKRAMVGFTDSLRSELIHDGSHVRVTVVHMPGLNTPQFSWCKTVMPRMAQLVPPIFQPEVGAEAV